MLVQRIAGQTFSILSQNSSRNSPAGNAAMKKSMHAPLDWHGMLKGHELLIKPVRKVL